MAAVLSSQPMAGISGIGPGTVFHDRLEEEQFFRTRGPPDLPLDVIRHVWMSFVGARDLALLFENGERRYALVVKVEDPAALGWKECQAVVDALKLVERGTRVSNESFTEMFAHFKTKYGRTEGPKIEHGILMGTVLPNRGTLPSEAPSKLKSTGIAFDREGDVMVRSETFGGQKYAVHVELSTKGQQQTLPSKKQALYKLDVRVLVDLLTLLETGDKVSPTDFLAGMAELREKYQFVSVDRFDGGKLVTGCVLASRVRNREPMPEILAKALNRKKAKGAGVPSPLPLPKRGAFMKNI
jgi:hypothetical protein